MTDSPVFHPQPDEHGKPVRLRHPSTPTGMQAWHDPARRATVIPLGALPGELNGISFAPWLDTPMTSSGWNQVDGQAGIVEPAFAPPPGKAAAAGVVIEEADGRIWAVAPSNRFGGYDATFPKGRVDPGVGLQANAIREAFEESGLRVQIVAFLVDSLGFVRDARVLASDDAQLNAAALETVRKLPRLAPATEADQPVGSVMEGEFYFYPSRRNATGKE